MRLIRIFLFLIIILSIQVLRASQMQKIFTISPALKCSRLWPAPSTQLPQFSFTQKHLRFPWEDIDTYMFYSPISQIPDAIEACAHVAAKALELEQKFEHSHFAFFHGTASTKFILLRTMLEQIKRKQQYEDFFWLRNKAEIAHLKNVTSGYNYVMQKINSVYTAQGKLGRFDNNDPMATDMLAVNGALYANVGSGGEDSISSLYYPNRRLYLEPKIKECLHSYGLPNLFSELPIYLQESLKEPLGSTLAIFVPKKLSQLVYASLSFGIPLGLSQKDLLEGFLHGDLLREELEGHTEVRIDDCFARQELFNQARIVLNPRYLENPESGIKMFMFVWQNEKNIQFLIDDFKFIASLAQKMIEPAQWTEPPLALSEITK